MIFRSVMTPRLARLAPLVSALWLFGSGAIEAQTAVSATFGDVIPLAGGTPSDVILDQLRHVLYLVNNTTSQVLIFDYTTEQIVGAIPVGRSPIAGAISMDGAWLYVTSGATPNQTASGSPLLNVIDLSSDTVVASVVLPSTPQGVEVGADGRALVSMLGTSATNGVLAIFDQAQGSGQQLQPVTVPALPSAPAPLPVTTLTRPVRTFSGTLMRTPDGSHIVGVITPTSSSTYIFVYEVASGTVLQNRTISGSSSVLSVSPDGTRFMAGMTMYDMSTLAIIAQQNNANAPFTFANAVNTTQNVGGSVFSPDGTTIYSAFNTAANTTPTPPPLSSTLLVGDPANLGIRLGINLPESIVAKMVLLSDGSQAWALSDSGLMHLPLGSLHTYPIIAPATTDVFLATDDCNRGIASGTLQINNAGQGRLTFSVATNTSSALVYRLSSGLAPATITFTMEPGRSGVTRYPGTNLWTGAGTSNGAPFNVTLSSPEAINIPPVIRVYMNYRQSDQRGVIFPLPTTPNTNPNNSAVAVAGIGAPTTAGNEGLQDIVLDEARNLLYITNSGYNRVEVFDTVQQVFDTPIPVGQLPHAMAMSTDGNTLYVANTGGESISIVDLNQQKVVDNVVFPPIPRNGTAALIYPKAIAMGLFGLQIVMSDGSQWELVNGDQATVRPADSITPVKFAGSPVYGMIAAPDYSYILTINGSGTVYLYNSLEDAYQDSRLIYTTTPIEGYYGPLGAGPGGTYLLAGGVIMNQSLTVIGGTANPGSTTIGPIIGPGGGGATVVNVGNRNVAALAPLGNNAFLRLTTPVRQSITTVTNNDSRTTLEVVSLVTGEDTLAGVTPENPVVSIFGTTRQNTSPRMMVADSAGAYAYAITLSGLSVISLTPGSASTLPAIASGATGIVNAADGSQNFAPGSFITINGTNLASAATAQTLPPPTVLGGSCVTFGDVAIPLLQTSGGQIQGQIPTTLAPGMQVVEVRSLATAQDSAPVLVTVKNFN